MFKSILTLVLFAGFVAMMMLAIADPDLFSRVLG